MATIPNTVEAFTSVDGTPWVVLRVFLSAVFTATLLSWALSLVIDWRNRGGRREKGSDFATDSDSPLTKR